MDAVDEEPLVCKLCVLDRYYAKLPPNIDEQPRFPTADALRAHWNSTHEKGWAGGGEPFQWKGTEPAWPFIIKEPECWRLGL